MTGIWLPLAATALAAALTYWCCIRPMRRQDGCHAAPPARTEKSVAEEIRRAREERDLLRARPAAADAAPGQDAEIRPQ